MLQKLAKEKILEEANELILKNESFEFKFVCPTEEKIIKLIMRRR